METSIQKAIRICGGQSALARACGVTQAAVFKWSRGGSITAQNAMRVERATGGKIRCEDLCPNEDWSVLRGPITERAA